MAGLCYWLDPVANDPSRTCGWLLPVSKCANSQEDLEQYFWRFCRNCIVSPTVRVTVASSATRQLDKTGYAENMQKIPSPAERDELLKGFASALFKHDIDALYKVVAPDFLWSFHDGLTTTQSLVGPTAIRDHLARQSALFSSQRFHEVT
jgi:hypothetical protein